MGRIGIGLGLREKLMESCTNDNPLLMSSVELIDSNDKTELLELLRSIDLIGRYGVIDYSSVYM